MSSGISGKTFALISKRRSEEIHEGIPGRISEGLLLKIANNYFGRFSRSFPHAICGRISEQIIDKFLFKKISRIFLSVFKGASVEFRRKHL